MKEIIVAGFAALKGTYERSRRDREEIGRLYPISLLKRADSCVDLIEEQDGKINDFLKEYAKEIEIYHIDGSMHEILWNFSKEKKCGFDIDLRSIPMLQETVEIAEYFEEDPFEWKCGGCALMVSDEVRTDHILEELNSHDIYAEVIGNVTEGKEKKLMIKDDVRFLNRV
ncbi:MAG: hypothetical protein K6G57_03465 [Lachnospiraceae bacterium]|nr:hypothetical protein [Lachnospiraceae bacterium]